MGMAGAEKVAGRAYEGGAKAKTDQIHNQ